MEILSALATVVSPLIVTLLPGLAAFNAKKNRPLSSVALIVLWSFVFFTLVSFAVVLLKLPVVVVFGFSLATTFLLGLYRWKSITSIEHIWISVGAACCIVTAAGLLSLPYVFMHDALPTGDSQKAIIWAQRIIERQSYPDYAISIPFYNRDPGDFFTPGLHTLTATVMTAAEHPLISVGLLSIIGSVAVALLAAAISREIFPGLQYRLVPVVSFLLVLSNIRFLRYLREPGYHYQNIFGEIFLFGLIFLGLRLIRKFSWHDTILSLFCLAALIITHQFSVFMAAFAVLPIAGTFFVVRLIKIHHHQKGVWRSIVAGSMLAVFLAIAAIPFGFYEKLPHLFTTTPHLLQEVPSLVDYPAIAGGAWFFFGVSGLVLLAVIAITRKQPLLIAFTLSAFVVLLLSQGPMIFIDIPPVRALYYSVVFLSVTGAFFLTEAGRIIWKNTEGVKRLLAIAVLLGILAVPVTTQARKTYSAVNHQVRTNSTLLPEYELLNEYLSNTQGDGVLIDDYNRRSASWLILSGKPMYTRIAADIRRQMDEAKQSDVRHNIYVNQLHFEKIFSLGSLPEAAHLATLHGITWITGIERSSNDAFSYNPMLQEVKRGGDTVLYKVNESQQELSQESQWLLEASTLVNDIGDREDTFAHLPASVRSPRLSQPIQHTNQTYRETTSPAIPLVFNTESYIRSLWDREHTSYAELLVRGEFSSPVTALLPDGQRVSLRANEGVTIPMQALSADRKGLITIILENPKSQPVRIDLIALGLALNR